MAVVKANLKLPKTEFVPFWKDIINLFKFLCPVRRIHEGILLKEVDEFHYIIQCMYSAIWAKTNVDS